MYRRLAIEYAIFNMLYRVVMFTLVALVIPLVGSVLVPMFFQYQLSPQAKWKFAQAFVFIGFLLGVLLGLHEDIRVFSTLYRVKQKGAKFFSGMDSLIINRYVQVSKDGTRQIRLTRDDAQFFEHCHFEMLDPVQSLTIENYVYGKTKKINETIWGYINRGIVSRQMIFFNMPKVSDHVDHISCKWSESMENAKTRLPSTQILLIVEMRLGVYLVRFSEELYYAGDTWHQTVSEAKMQAAYEYDVADSAWQIIPDDVVDMVKFFSDQKRKMLQNTDK
ncbi:MAG: hypothetical protein H6659_14065 [Ardenticatenaceae bacterium]|nr:hypothetical protein [Ardenticatenaceae bacterium]MCB8988595.1 hypothetical protein [Ardenticatenaceae bacterium]